MASIGWTISNGAENVAEGVVDHPGILEADTLGQLILNAIAEISPGHPFTHIDYDIEANEFFPQIPGRMDIVIMIPVLLGTQITY